jgi:ATP-dependent DNA ligase
VPGGKRWIHEIKFDGYKTVVKLRSKNRDAA